MISSICWSPPTPRDHAILSTVSPVYGNFKGHRPARRHRLYRRGSDEIGARAPDIPDYHVEPGGISECWIAMPRKYADVLWREPVGYAATGLYSRAQLVEQKRSALVSRRLVWMTPLQLSQRDGFTMRY